MSFSIDNLLLKGIGGFYYVKTADGIYECRAKGILRKRGIVPCAGDRVVLEIEPTTGSRVISDVLPRNNHFFRPPAANIDNYFLVVSSIDPKPNSLVNDKLLCAAIEQGIYPVILLTKTDLISLDNLATDYRKVGFEVIDTRLDNDALDRIRQLAAGRISLFVGNSGVGKSTLINRLCPEHSLEVRETSKKLGRGKHTTRAVELHSFLEGYLVDTPGFSDLDTAKRLCFDKERLQDLYLEFEPYKDYCYFTGCSHTVEKGCAVLEALKNGDIPEWRHQNYCSLYEESSARNSWEN